MFQAGDVFMHRVYDLAVAAYPHLSWIIWTEHSTHAAEKTPLSGAHTVKTNCHYNSYE